MKVWHEEIDKVCFVITSKFIENYLDCYLKKYQYASIDHLNLFALSSKLKIVSE